MLNDFSRGAKKRHVDAALSLVVLGILLTVFLAFGWKAGFLAVVLAFVYAALSRPFAARIAARLMSLGGGPSGTYIGLPPRSLERISRELARGMEMRPAKDMLRERMAGPSRHQKAVDALLDYCLAQPSIQSLMQELGADRTTLKDLYSTLCITAGQWAGGHWVAALGTSLPALPSVFAE